MENVYYNETKYNLEVTISRINEDTFSDKLILPYDSISEITIINDLADPFPRLILTIKDPTGENISKYPVDGLSFINFYLSYQDQDDPLEILHNFVIDNVEILEKSNEEILYKLECSSQFVPIWNSHVWYSTKEQLLSTTQIIEQIMKQTKLLYTNSNTFNHSSKKLTYITPVNTTIKDCIDELTIWGSSDTDGLYFLGYNLVDNTHLIIGTKKIFEAGFVENYNVIKIPTKYGFGDTEEITKNLVSNNYVKGTGLYDLYSKVTLNDFNYINRSWLKSEYNTKRLDKHLSKNHSDIDKMYTEFKGVPELYNLSSQFNFEKENNQYPFVTDRMKTIFKFVDVLQFDCTGYLKRDVGDLFIVRMDEDTQPLYNKHVGTYMISRIYHTFTKGKYEQNLSLIRTHKIKNMTSV